MADTSVITVQIVSIEFDKEVQGQSKTYNGTEIIYKSKDGKVYNKGFATTAYQYNKGLREGLEALKPNDFAEVTIQKNGSYSNWTAVKKVTIENSSRVAAEPNKQAETPIREAVARTYETAEERAAKQLMIVRQSSLSTAVALAATDHSDFNYEPQHIIQMAKEFEAYVMGNEQTDTQLPD